MTTEQLESVLEAALRQKAAHSRLDGSLLQYQAVTQQRSGGKEVSVSTIDEHWMRVGNDVHILLSDDLADILPTCYFGSSEYNETRQVAADWVLDNPGRCFAQDAGGK